MDIKEFINKYKTEVSLFLTCFVLAFTLYSLTSLKYPNDDQFILYRYIDNIVEGNGFVYNMSERVLGSTTPLFTLLASFFKYLFISVDTPVVVAYLNILLLSLSSAFLYRVARKFISNNLSIFAVIVFILNLSRTIPEGMETPLFLLLLFIFLDRILDSKNFSASIFLALAILTRPDAGLVAVLAFFFWWQRVGLKETIKLTLVCLVTALPWLVFSFVYFGNIVPQSLLAKLHSEDIVNLPAIQGAKVQLSSISRIYWGRIFDPENIMLQTIFNLIPVSLLIFIGVKNKISKHNWILFAIPFIYFLSFSISNPVMFPWYVSQVEPMWILLSVFGLGFLLSFIKNNYIKILICAILILGPFSFWFKNATTTNTGTKMALFQIADYINKNKKTSDTIGLSNIGIVGYFTDLYIVDFFGLIRPSSVEFYPIIDKCLDTSKLFVIPPELVIDSKPDWLMASDGEMVRCFKDGEWMRENYKEVYNIGEARVYRKIGYE